MLSFHSVSSIFTFNSNKVGWGNILDKTLSAESLGEEERMDVSPTIRKLLDDYVEGLFIW